MKPSKLIILCLTLIVFGLVFIVFGKFLKLNENINGKVPGDRALLIGMTLELAGLLVSARLFSQKNKD